MKDKNLDYKKLANLCYEIGTLRKIALSHRQNLFINDSADNIGSHSHRVACIAFMIAKMENIDTYKTAVMALFHDVPETRSGDQNWIHKIYVKVNEDEIIKDQFENLPFSDIFNTVSEYDKRETKESLAAKNTDLLDQILLLKEYEWSGSKEAAVWLSSKRRKDKGYQLSMLKTKSGKKLGESILITGPSEWWENSWTNKNKK